ncbi:MAG: chorismate mutase [Acetobacteraceae bacterium]
MSSSAPTVDTPSAAEARDEPPPQDGWPGGLPALRAELDRIDDTLHDLLMRRAKVVEHVARSGKASAFRPGREASIIRRLVARHGGSLPAQTLFRMWREMLAGTTAMQAPVVVAVCETDPGGAMTALSREHFGTLTPIHVHGGPARALSEVSNGSASVAVLPFPSEDTAWWTTLLHREPRVHVIARLPFWTKRSEGAPDIQALVVASTAPDASGQDRSFLGIELEQETSRARIVSGLTAAGLKPDAMVVLGNQVLVEVDGFVAEDDPRLARLSPAIGRPIVLGAYAVPIGGAAS